MPRPPIQSREAFYDTLRDGSIYDLDWNLVNTELGAMVEPRQLPVGVADVVAEVDRQDLSVSRRVLMEEDRMFSLIGTSGPQLPVDFSS